MATTEFDELNGISAASVPPGLLLAKIGRAAMRQFTEALKPTALTTAHLMTLFLLGKGSISQQDLATSVDVDPTKLVGLLNDLEREGLVERRRDPADRRRHIVEISAAGKTRLADAEAAVAAVEEQLLSGLDDRQRGELQQLLERIGESTGVDSCVDDTE